MRLLLFLVFAALYLIRMDLWWWDDPTLLGGIPIGLLSQVVFCFLVTTVMALVVRFAWPPDLDEVEEQVSTELPEDVA